MVVIGGGVMGASSAFHLAEAGQQVLLVERDDLASGSTVKAAGGVRAQFSDAVNIELGHRSLRVFERFGELFGQEIDFHQVGYLFLLDSEEHAATFEANVALQNSLDVPSRMLTPDQAQELSPLISTEGLVAAAFSPTDGHCAPESVVQGYASAARRAGAVVATRTAVTGVERDADGRVARVLVGGQTVECDLLVVTAGPWSEEVGTWCGVDLPVTPMRRQILITDAMPGLRADTPMTIDFATSFYFHNEGDGLLIGMSDPNETPGFKLKRDDAWLDGLFEAIEHRAPSLSDIGVSTGWAGLYEMTPDHNALIGRSGSRPGEPDNVVYATGFSGHGFLMGPAIGEVVRDLCLDNEPVVDVSSLSADRFAAGAARPELNIV